MNLPKRQGIEEIEAKAFKENKGLDEDNLAIYVPREDVSCMFCKYATWSMNRKKEVSAYCGKKHLEVWNKDLHDTLGDEIACDGVYDTVSEEVSE